MSWRYLVLGLTVALFGGSAAAAANCTENCELCFRHLGCYSCKQGYYWTDGECEKCNPTCKRCSKTTGVCYFECKDGWYGQYCSHACSCSYGTCDKHTGSCPHQKDPPVSTSHDDEYYHDDEYTGKILGLLTLPIGMVIICYCCMKRKRNTDEEQMADDIPDIIPPSQKLVPGQTPITTRSTNITYPNFFAGNFTTHTSNNDNSIMCPPQRTDLAPPPCSTYSDQHTDQVPPPCATYSVQETDTGLPPSYTSRANTPPPPSYESLFDSKKEHIQESFT